MTNVEPSEEFKEEMQNQPVPPAAAPTAPVEETAAVANPSVPAPLPPKVWSPDDGRRAPSWTQRRWVVESVFITLFALVVIGLSLEVAVPVLLSNASENDKFFIALVAGMPALFGVLILRRSELARIMIVVFMVIDVVMQLLPWGGHNVLSIALEGFILIFFSTSRIRQHF